ncbi:MAG: SDR family NAD(P)-dependent oxidoreductase [Gemmatimonadetes bacterium]|nr:SDR family NAD(P)-dependent oxidoreductase [Gemmatimonadota bacterium]
MSGNRVLVTGGAGFIGSHLCERLVATGHRVVALDSFDPFYPEAVKRRNLAALSGNPAFTLVEADIRDPGGMAAALDAADVGDLDVVVHLAARAGVRPSIADPLQYVSVNVDGTVAVLELARARGARRFVFGSSSSVYGNNEVVPFSEAHPVDHPISPYATTKRAGELLCHTYHHLFGLSVVCLRFFTVYGPRQRPDLAIHKFARLIAEGRGVPMYGDGSSERDYTYIDDILQGVEGAIRFTDSPQARFEIVNLGESRTTSLARLIQLVGEAMDVTPAVERQPPQPGDVQRTFADVSRARELLGYRPTTPVEEGIPRFVEWLKAEAGAV